MEVRKYFALSTHDGFIWLITFLSTVLLDVDYGNIIQSCKLLNKVEPLLTSWSLSRTLPYQEIKPVREVFNLLNLYLSNNVEDIVVFLA